MKLNIESFDIPRMPSLTTLNDWLAHLAAAYPVPIDLDLTRMRKMKTALTLSFDCPVITVGGTNGKGSTCALIEAILLQAGYRVGCYTSPHLLTFNERARINGQNAPERELLDHFHVVERARTCFKKPVSLTYFEFTTLAIMHWLASHALDAIILEVGLGGRLDAVNVIDADCAVITNIGIDHTEYLGATRDKIAIEKAGIFRPGKPAICSDPLPPKTLIDCAHNIGADLWQIGYDFCCATQTDIGNARQQWCYRGRTLSRSGLAYPALRGTNQLLNASAALAALEALYDTLPVSAQAIRLGLATVKLPARFQVLPGQPTVILDVAHNPHAVAVLKQNLSHMGFFSSTYAVFGALQDKDITNMIRHMKSEVDHWCLTDLPTPRAVPAQTIKTLLHQTGVRESVKCFPTPGAAYQDALSRACQNDRILIFGSFHTVAGVMAATQ